MRGVLIALLLSLLVVGVSCVSVTETVDENARFVRGGADALIDPVSGVAVPSPPLASGEDIPGSSGLESSSTSEDKGFLQNLMDSIALTFSSESYSESVEQFTYFEVVNEQGEVELVVLDTNGDKVTDPAIIARAQAVVDVHAERGDYAVDKRSGVPLVSINVDDDIVDMSFTGPEIFVSRCPLPSVPVDTGACPALCDRSGGIGHVVSSSGSVDCCFCSVPTPPPCNRVSVDIVHTCTADDGSVIPWRVYTRVVCEGTAQSETIDDGMCRAMRIQHSIGSIGAVNYPPPLPPPATT